MGEQAMMKRPLIVLLTEIYAGLIVATSLLGLKQVIEVSHEWLTAGRPLTQLIGASVLLLVHGIFAMVVLWSIELRRSSARWLAVTFLWTSFLLYPVQVALRGSVLPPVAPRTGDQQLAGAFFEISRSIVLIGGAIWLRASKRFRKWLAISTAPTLSDNAKAL